MLAEVRVVKVPQPITPLAYTSLAELYGHFVREFVEKSPIIAACGCRVHCYEHHFVHLVKLFGPGQSNFSFRHEKAKILATIDGFGEYEHEARRAVRLLAALETIRTPDIVVRPSQKLKNGDRAFVKEFNDATYPYMVVIVHRENSGLLALTTAVPTRHRNLKDWIVGEQLFPKTPQPSPQGMAV